LLLLGSTGLLTTAAELEAERLVLIATTEPDDLFVLPAFLSPISNFHWQSLVRTQLLGFLFFVWQHRLA
jgi:hypothetical protein